MQAYKSRQKILKTKPCSYYRATHSSSSEVFIVKKLNKSLTWQEVLQSKSLTLCKNTKCKYIAKIKEIIREESSFYCIMENSEVNLTEVIKNDIQRRDIYKVARQLVELVVALSEEKIVVRDVRPAHLFLNQNRNGLKLYHFETVSEKDLTELDLTELQDLRYIAPEQVLTKKGSNEKSLVFSIGLIIAELVLGQPLLNAKNKLEYIFQLTHLFPNDRVDKMKGSDHQFKNKELQQDKTFSNRMLEQSEIGQGFIALLQKMLKIDHSQRIPIEGLLETMNVAIESEEDFHKNKEETNKENKFVNLPNRNQVNIENETIKQIEFDFENKPTLSSIPLIFSQQKSSNFSKGSAVLLEEENVQDDGTQPIIIKQAALSTSNRSKQHGIHHNNNFSLKKGLIQKANQPQTPHSISNINMFSNSKPGLSIPPLYSTESPSHGMISYTSDPLNVHRQNQMLKNSRSTKQTTLNTIKKPQLTNYAMNEANLGLKVAMNNTLFSENNYDQEEFS